MSRLNNLYFHSLATLATLQLACARAYYAPIEPFKFNIVCINNFISILILELYINFFVGRFTIMFVGNIYTVISTIIAMAIISIGL